MKGTAPSHTCVGGTGSGRQDWMYSRKTSIAWGMGWCLGLGEGSVV